MSRDPELLTWRRQRLRLEGRLAHVLLQHRVALRSAQLADQLERALAHLVAAVAQRDVERGERVGRARLAAAAHHLDLERSLAAADQGLEHAAAVADLALLEREAQRGDVLELRLRLFEAADDERRIRGERVGERFPRRDQNSCLKRNQSIQPPFETYSHPSSVRRTVRRSDTVPVDEPETSFTFKNLLQSQNKATGEWQGAQVGPVFCTACYLSLLQMDKAVLPLYQR